MEEEEETTTTTTKTTTISFYAFRDFVCPGACEERYQAYMSSLDRSVSGPGFGGDATTSFFVY
jgi:hypothetical protein